MHTTTNLLKIADSCRPGYRRLCDLLAKFDWPKDDNRPIPYWFFLLSSPPNDISDLKWVFDHSLVIEPKEFREIYGTTYRFSYAVLLPQMLQTYGSLLALKDANAQTILEDFAYALGLKYTGLSEISSKDTTSLPGSKKKVAVKRPIATLTGSRARLSDILSNNNLEIPSIETLNERIQRLEKYVLTRGSWGEFLEFFQRLNPDHPKRYLDSLFDLCTDPPGRNWVVDEFFVARDDDQEEEVQDDEDADEAEAEEARGSFADVRRKVLQQKKQDKEEKICKQHPAAIEIREYYNASWRDNTESSHKMLHLLNIGEKLRSVHFKNENKKNSTVSVRRSPTGSFQEATVVVSNPLSLLRIQDILREDQKLSKQTEEYLPNVVAL